MVQEEIRQAYFEYLYWMLCENKDVGFITYRQLFEHLHKAVFTYSVPKDGNRASDGVELRRRFYFDQDVQIYSLAECEEYLTGECSMLEMLAALALRCEETIMSDPAYGNRTKTWFWNMLMTMGIGSMPDDKFNETKFNHVMYRVINREYRHDGTGGLFKIPNAPEDLRQVEIWTQMLWYLDYRFM